METRGEGGPTKGSFYAVRMLSGPPPPKTTCDKTSHQSKTTSETQKIPPPEILALQKCPLPLGKKRTVEVPPEIQVIQTYQASRNYPHPPTP